MSGPVAGATLLAAALLLVPRPPQQRLLRRRKVVPRQTMAVVGICCASVVGVMLPAAVVLAAVVLAIALGVRRRRGHRARQRMAEGQTLASALEVLVGELSVGAHPARALAVAAEESGGAVGAALGVVGARAQLGGDVVGGLLAAADSSLVPTYWYRLATCWHLAAQHGLAISLLIRTAHRDIVERQRFTARVEAGLAGARATAAILAGLPVIGVFFGQLIGARPLEFLLGGSVGGWILVVGVLLVCAGLAWSDRITDRLSM